MSSTLTPAQLEAWTLVEEYRATRPKLAIDKAIRAVGANPGHYWQARSLMRQEPNVHPSGKEALRPEDVARLLRPRQKVWDPNNLRWRMPGEGA